MPDMERAGLAGVVKGAWLFGGNRSSGSVYYKQISLAWGGDGTKVGDAPPLVNMSDFGRGWK